MYRHRDCNLLCRGVRVTDRTEAFIVQVYEFLDSSFTGEMRLQCKDGRVLELNVTQRIKISDGSTKLPIDINSR